MRRPKAAIPILPPPDNQQSGRGRGRSTQQYQHNNQSGGNVQQTEEIKNAVESDEKIMSGQFDSVEIESSSIPKQEYEKDQPTDMIATTDDTNKSAEESINVEMQTKLDTLSSAKTDNMDNSDNTKELLEITSNEKDSVSHNPTTTLTTIETKRELDNIESAISENTITLTAVETERELSNIESDYYYYYYYYYYSRIIFI
jgi:hypothetical protein